MKIFKLETLITLLLIATLTPISVNHFCPRHLEVTVTPDDDWAVATSDDRISGGSSTSKIVDSENGFAMEYETVDAHNTPYAVFVISSDTSFYDLSWMESMRIKLRNVSLTDDHLRVQLRNIQRGITGSQFTGRKYNEFSVQVDSNFRVIDINRSDFHVPSWWIQEHDVLEKEKRPQFDQINTIEVCTSGRSGTGRIEIASIEFTGHQISEAMLYPALLSLWMVSFVIVLLVRLVRLRRTLNEKQAVESRLRALNIELSHKSRELSDLACQDQLTGLLNRRGIPKWVDDTTGQLTSHQLVTLIVFDVDQFKTLNDSHGHTYGDNVLKELATIASDCVSEQDVVVRWGGDEFLIICPDTTQQQAVSLAERLRARFADSDLGFACSFGVARTAPTDDFATNLDRADRALYDAKSGGRNRVNVFCEPQSGIKSQALCS